MAAVTAAVVAVGAGAAMNARAKQKASEKAWKSSKWNPFALEGGGGSITFGPDGQMITSEGAESEMFRNMFSQWSSDIAGGGGFGQGAIDFASEGGSMFLPQAFMDAQQQSEFLPGGAVDAFSNFSAQNAALGQSMGLNALAAANDFGSRQTGINEGMAQTMFGFGQDALSNTDFSALAAEQIERQRAFARPGEERAVNSKFQNLLNRGVLSQTGGQRQVGELALAQEMADIQRVNAGESFANVLREQNRAFGLNAMQQGAGFRQMDQSFNLGAANLFSQAGQNLMNFGQNAGQSGLNAQMAFSEMVNSRGQQRLANAQGLLGFGQQMNLGNFGQIMQMFGGIGALNTQMQNLMALSGNLSAQRSAANAKAGGMLMQGAGSPFGSFLQGAGSAYLGGGFGGGGG